MLISTSILNIQNNREKLNELFSTNTDMIHLDIMDGRFVENKTIDFEILKENLKGINKPIDIHFMTYDIKSYIDKYKELNPKYITFHIEALKDAMDIIHYIRQNNINVGITLNPSTDINLLLPYLKYVDLVLVMSVEPGRGGQEFLTSSLDKVKWLKERQEENGYKIEIDGGVNDKIMPLLGDVDIAVLGSFITNSDNYAEALKKIKG